ncbi:MAG: UDP-3-O-[3-hydroxymyristoyl] N-acetylglucosamine deacetylase [Candidatus Dadabacteria bacterium]|nr:MAG: UDP-3-O-[3-hydroxymyristoyl] N-acetylglucosamine deacetylase [Candidatus Dadabacteria bacterium]
MGVGTNISESDASSVRTVLVVDDEESICRSLERVLADEGFKPLVAHNGEDALRKIHDYSPALVLLDIWLPGADGMETLRRIKSEYPALPVIMISGHATIGTAVTATKLGAVDFIEKPLDLDVILASVRKALGLAGGSSKLEEPERQERESTATRLRIGIAGEELDLNPIAFRHNTLRGKAVKQRTLASSALLYGQGLHTGQKSGLILEPLPPNSGIHFVGISGGTVVPAHVDFVESTGFATTVKLGETQVSTIEHLMSALHVYRISNLLVKCNGEIPVMDGSAVEFCRIIEDAGLDEQDGEWYEIALPEKIEVGAGNEKISIEPDERFVIDYTLNYPEPVGQQRFVFCVDDPESYKREIAPARTFGFVRDIGRLQQQGLAQGGRFDNFVLIGEDGAINDNLRFENEPVRHKILDAIGDLYLLGRPISGRVTAHLTGHSDNYALLNRIWQAVKASAAL